MDACRLCQDVIHAEASDGGALISDEYVVAYHLTPNDRFPKQYLGRVLLVTRRHVDHLADLTQQETVSVALAARRLAQALRRMESVERVHLALIGVHHPHFHLHVYPRYDWMPPEADWNALQARDDAPLGGPTEIVRFAERLRQVIPPAAI